MVSLQTSPHTQIYKIFTIFMKTREDVLSILLTHPNGNVEEHCFKKKFPEIYSEVLLWSFPDDFKFSQKLYHYFNEDPDLKLGICPVCGNRCKFRTFNIGYSVHCSKKCTNNDKSVRNKIESTNLKRYGNKNNLWSESGRKKVLDTCMKHWGVDNVLKSDVIKEKIKQTNIKRYGCEYPSQNKEIKIKKEETSLFHYGFKYPNQSQIVINKRRNTNLNRYGCTCTLLNPDIVSKSFDTKLQRYGNGNYVNSKKTKETKLKRYGDENYNNSKKISKSLSSEDVKIKMYNTKKKNKTFNTSTIEDKLKSYLDKNSIRYITLYKSELYPFLCDFYLPDYDLYIEIQGTWTHGFHPFDYNDVDDIRKLNNWKEKSIKSKYYKTAIDVWTKTDVLKRTIANKNNINYLEVFSIKLDVVIDKIRERIF